MLSASTISSSSSSAFSGNAGGSSTPSSQYSNDSRRHNGGNPLTELIDTEQSFMETLKIIDSQIGPIWMKLTSDAPDFSELLRCIHNILKANQRFCMKLTKIASNPANISELGDVLMQWVDDLEVPYANYCRSFIPNLNHRSDVLSNPSIQTILHNLSANISYEISLESLFNAPIQQLKYYKGLYSRLLEGTNSGRADYKLLLNANKRIDVIMVMARNNNNPPSTNAANKTNSSLNIQTNFIPSSSSSDLAIFERQVDCSRTVDLYGGAKVNYQLRLNNQLLMRDSFIMLPNENNGGDSTIRVHLVLTTEVLVICRELSQSQFLLMYPVIPIGDIIVKSESLDREIVGEYIIRFSVLGKKHIMLRADSKEIRNTWLGVDQDASNSVLATPRTLSAAAQKKMLGGIGGNIVQQERSHNNKSIRNTDIFTFYSENGGVSPLESSDEEYEVNSHNPLLNQKKPTTTTNKSRDTIMDIYEGHLYDFEDNSNDFPVSPPAKKRDDLANVVPQTVKVLPHVPNVSQATQEHVHEFPPIPPNKQDHQQPAVSQPVKDSSHVQMQYIEPPTAQLATMSISPPISSSSAPQLNNPSSSTFPSPQQQQQQINKNNMVMNDKPSSPRAVEVQRAVIPEAMQAVTQKTDEYINGNTSRFQTVPNIPRTSSMRNGGSNAPKQVLSPRLQLNPQHQQKQQRPPPPQGGNGYQQQQHQQRPLNGSYQQQPRPPMHQQQQQQPYGYNRPMPSSPPQQQQFNNNRPPRPMVSSPNNGQQLLHSPRLQQPPGRLNTPSPSMGHLQDHRGSSVEDLSSPPHSPNPYNTGNDIRQILYTNSQCDVFHWNNQSWYAAEGQCLLQIRVTHSNRVCVAVQLQNTGQLYLNAWILPTTVIRQPSPTDVNISLYMGVKKENYLIHFAHPQDANVFANILRRVHAESAHQQVIEPEIEEREPVDNVNVPQTLNLVMECKAKLFIKNETSNWSTFGGVSMRISQQSPSTRMLIQIENDKAKLVSAIVKSGNVEKISSKRISFLLVDEVQKTSIVYMVHLREDQTGNKIYEYLRTKNAENGW